MNRIEPLASPQELKKELPISQNQLAFVHQSRVDVNRILKGEDSRLLLIVGPCSIHDVKAAEEYAIKLRDLAKSVSDSFLVLMRVYFEKPRTALGWKGLLYDPHLDDSNNISTGLRWTRQLLLDLTELKIPIATEILDPAAPGYFSDLISWGCIGARTAASQTHRQIVSGLPIPIAFKNSTDGNINIAINGVLAAAHPHSYLGVDDAGRTSVIHTSGNEHCHVVLRGGDARPNYDIESIRMTLKHLELQSLPQRVLVDCSHGNSNRKHERQPIVFQSVMHQILEGNRQIRGMLIESNLHEGNQPFLTDRSQLQYAVSVTDPCIDWITTESLINWGHAKFSKQRAANL